MRPLRSPAESFGAAVAVLVVATVGALWLGVLVGVAVWTVRAINGW